MRFTPSARSTPTPSWCPRQPHYRCPSGAEVGDVSAPTNPVAKIVRVGKAVVHNLKPAHPEHHERPQLNVPTIDARWYLLSQVDGVTVTTADGRGVV